MSAKKTKKRMSGLNIAMCGALLPIAVILIVMSVVGFFMRNADSVDANLHNMRDNAILHAASEGIIESIASDAKAEKQKELRKDPDFRKMGLNEVNEKLAEAENTARAEARAIYSGAENADTTKIRETVIPLSDAINDYNVLMEKERGIYAGIYTEIYESVADWTDFETGLTDEELLAKMKKLSTSLGKYPQLESGMIKFARNMSKAEKTEEDNELYQQLYASAIGKIAGHEDYQGLTDDQLYQEIVKLEPAFAEREDFKSKVLKDVKKHLEDLANGVEQQAPAEEVIAETEFTVDYAYFAESDVLKALNDVVDEKYEALFTELCVIIPDLKDLPKKMQNTVRETLEEIAYADYQEFSERYGIYADQNSNKILVGADRFRMFLAAYASTILIAGLAILLLVLVSVFWKPLTKRFGIPRTIITLFFIYLCFAAELYNIYVPLMLSNILVRVGMYGVLALAMLPGIQCGIGLNMGMTLGCIAGLLSTIIALQYNMTGYGALAFSCVGGALIAIPLGWAYSLLLNRMKGSEMTISTYVGFSFVSLMCIGWMLLPFTNPKIIWLLSGKGLRVTHSLLGSFAHILDDLFAFTIFGIEIPTGLILFFLLCCGIMWLFSRSKIGVAMTAAGNNPRFAEASGINVNHMRTLGTVLSTMIAAVGIVIYSQAFGYAQLYTAPRQMGFIAASIILIGGATVSRAKVSHVIIGVFLFEGVLALGQQIANAAVAGGGLSEVMRIMISNGIILYALTQSGGGTRE